MNYKNVSIEKLENRAETQRKNASSNRKEFIEILFYLRQTSRFKENPQYKNSSFSTYLRDKWMMSEFAFDQERVAYIGFPKETEALGPGVVTEAVKKCGGAKKAKVVLDKIVKVDEKLKNGVKREKIQEIIQENIVPKSPPVITMADLRAEIKRLRHVIDNRDRTIKDQRRTIDEQAEQIDRLKEALLSYEDIYMAAAI